MIESAEEFVRLRDSEEKAEYDRSALEEAPVSVWRDVIFRYPSYRKWVAHNKTIPLEILEELCQYEADVKIFVAMKRQLSNDLFVRLAADPSAVVRQQVAANKKVPLDLLKNLSLDLDEDVARVARFNLNGRSK
jgi:hypothetical protein